MNQEIAIAKQEENQVEVTVVTLEEIEQRENATNQVACCIWNFN
jgi:hypothetical protein